jgi:hypothetical protein
MPAVLVRWKGYRGQVYETTPEDLLGEALEDPAFIYPYEILKSMLETEERPDGVSMTTLLNVDRCLRCSILEKYEDYVVDLEKLWKPWKGTAYHGIIERHTRKGGIAEVRFWAKLPGGGEVHGKPDLILPDSLIDLKTTDNPPRWDDPWADHVEQVQGYRWLVNNAYQWEGNLGKFSPAAWKCEHLVIWYVDVVEARGIPIKPLEVRRTKEVATKKGASNPYKKVKEPDIWDDDKVLKFIRPRYDEVIEAFSEYERSGILPPYPKGFNYLTDWTHRFKPTAELCVERHIEELARRVA